MTDLCDKFLHEVKEEAHAKRVPFTKAMHVYLRSYDTHKNVHGSFKNLPHEHYQAAMNDRYRFMRTEAMTYIHEEHERRQHENHANKPKL